MPRIFIVVAHTRPDLYEYFRASFAGFDAVEVLMDRRLRSGRAPSPPGSSPGEADRRTPIDVYDELQARGFVIVRVPG
ncbi:MAG: hypothetical protein ACREJG_07600 [Candidatus Rokuibacteriota bacterium]